MKPILLFTNFINTSKMIQSKILSALLSAMLLGLFVSLQAVAQPTANDDYYVFPQDAPVEMTWLSNDIIDAEEVTISIVASSQYGDVVLENPEVPGDYIFFSGAGETVTLDVSESTELVFVYSVIIDVAINIPDTLVYQICTGDTPDTCDEATVYINYEETTPLTANDDYYVFPQSAYAEMTWLDNDIIDAEEVTISVIDQPQFGAIVVDNPEVPDDFIYLEEGVSITINTSASADFIFGHATFLGMPLNMPDTLVYQICIGNTLDICDEAIVHINYEEQPEDIVIASDDSASVDPELLEVLITPLDNDTGVALEIVATYGAVFGETSINADGTILYEAYSDGVIFNDEFYYIVCNNVLGLCDTGTVFIYPSTLAGITTANDEAITENDQVVNIDVYGNDLWVPYDHTLAIYTEPSHGTASFGSGEGIITYTPNPGFVGVDYFDYIICLETSPIYCSVSTVTVIVQSVTPIMIAGDDEVSVNMNGEVVIEPLANDWSLEGNTLFISDILDGPNNGTLAWLDEPYSLVYMPDTDFAGADTFSYVACDELFPEDCETATVYINIDENTTFVFYIVLADDEYTVLSNDTLALEVFNNDDILPAGPIVFDVLEAPVNGTLITIPPVTGELPTLRYFSEPGYVGPDSFTYSICDDITCDTATVYINVLTWNTSIIAVDDEVTVIEGDAGGIIMCLENDYSLIGESFYVAGIFEEPANGIISWPEDPSGLMYTPNVGFTGTDVFSYIACHVFPTEGCDTATIFINVVSSESNNYFAVDDTIHFDANASINFEVLGNDSFIEPHIVSLCAAEFGMGTIESDYTITYSLNTIPTATEDLLCYVVCDEITGICDTAAIIIIFDTAPPTCEYECVWPGDANQDGIANNFDVLALGLGYSLTGPTRLDASTDWTPQVCDAWTDEIILTTPVDTGSVTTVINAKHADCDGNGEVTTNDVEVVLLNYGLEHGKNTGTNEMEGLLWIDMPQTAEANTWVSADVMIGNADTPLEDIHGLAFTLNYDTFLIDPNNTTLSFDDSWLSEGDPNAITLVKDFADGGTLDIALSRTDQAVMSGYGKVATVNFFIIDNIDGKTEDAAVIPFEVSASNAMMATSQGTMANMETLGGNTEVTTGIFNNAALNNVVVAAYPNPAQNSLLVATTSNIETLQLYNMLGQVMYQRRNLSTQEHTIDVGQLANGIYYLQVTTAEGDKTIAVEVLH